MSSFPSELHPHRCFPGALVYIFQKSHFCELPIQDPLLSVIVLGNEDPEEDVKQESKSAEEKEKSKEKAPEPGRKGRMLPQSSADPTDPLVRFRF